MQSVIYVSSAFLLGALHGLEPGHGKTVMAAYLVGSRGTMRHAVLLGAVVTFTHTFSVVLMGILAVVAAAFFVPQQVELALEVISGLLVVLVGGWMFYARVLKPRKMAKQHLRHDYGDHHDHEHDHDHGHSHDLPASDKLSWGSLVAMGVSGGMVPCPAALATLLTAVSLGNTVGGLAMVVVFSLGLAAVLISIGIGLLKAAGLASSFFDGNGRFAAWSGAVSSIVVMGLGLALTAKAFWEILGA